MRILYTLGLLLLVTPLMAESCEGCGGDPSGFCLDTVYCQDTYCPAVCGEPVVTEAFCNPEDSFCDCGDCGGGAGGTGGTGGTGGAGGTIPTCETACGELDCVEFFDGAFEENDWLDEVVSVTPDPGFGEHGVDQGGVPGSTAPDDGNPAPYRFVFHTVGEDSGIWVAHEKPAANYDPGSAGAIESIHYSFDGKALEGSRQASIRPLAKQDGRWFWTAFTPDQLINENGWVTKRWDDASLIPVDQGVELDLSGAQITVGFATGASHTTGVDMVTRNTGVDNWRVVICHEPLLDGGECDECVGVNTAAPGAPPNLSTSCMPGEEQFSCTCMTQNGQTLTAFVSPGGCFF